MVSPVSGPPLRCAGAIYGPGAPECRPNGRCRPIPPGTRETRWVQWKKSRRSRRRVSEHAVRNQHGFTMMIGPARGAIGKNIFFPKGHPPLHLFQGIVASRKGVCPLRCAHDQKKAGFPTGMRPNRCCQSIWVPGHFSLTSLRMRPNSQFAHGLVGLVFQRGHVSRLRPVSAHHALKGNDGAGFGFPGAFFNRIDGDRTQVKKGTSSI